MAEKRRLKVPHTLVLLFGMIVLAWLASLVLPAGAYERHDHDGHQVVVPGTYHRIEREGPFGVGDLLTPLTVVPRGFASVQDIIFFVFIIGGAFAVLRATGAVDASIGLLLRRFGDRRGWLIAIGVTAFAAGSSGFGMAEEYLPFVPILLLLARGMGMDAVTGVGIMCVGYGVGYGTAVLNPFTVMIAQNIAGLPPASGMWFRLLLTPVMLAIGIHHVWSYATKVAREPSRSLVSDLGPPPVALPSDPPALGRRHVAVLAVTFAALGLLVWGLASRGWYLVEMGALFLGLTIVLGAVGGLGADRIAVEFCRGATDLTTTALLIGFANSIKLVLADAQVIDTIVHGIAQPLRHLGPSLAAAGMFLVQSVCNFFIPSGSGQAYVTMPLMAPLSDVLGITRQVAVLAYQFGDGFTNIVVPTNAVLMGILAMAGIPFDRWLRFVTPLMLKVWVVGSLALVVAVQLGYA